MFSLSAESINLVLTKGKIRILIIIRPYQLIKRRNRLRKNRLENKIITIAKYNIENGKITAVNNMTTE